MIVKRMIAVGLLTLACGCATVQLSSKGSMENGERLLAIQNDGYTLLGILPIASGSLDYSPLVMGQGSTGPRFFSNHADTQHLYSLAMKVAEKEKCDLKDVVFIDNSSQLDFSCLYGAVIHDDVAISAVLVPRK